MAVPAREGSAFEVVQTEASFQFAVVVFYPPADLCQSHKFGHRCVIIHVGQPVGGRLLFVVGPFGKQPLVRNQPDAVKALFGKVEVRYAAA